MGRIPRPSLGGPSVEMGKTDLPPEPAGDLGEIAGGALRRLLGQAVRRLVVLGASMGWDCRMVCACH